LWQGPDGFTDNTKDPLIQNITVDQAGLYRVKITSPDGCIDSALTEIDVVQTIELVPVLNSSSNPINPAQEITLSVSIPNTIINPAFEWMFNGNVVSTGNDTAFVTRDIVTSLDVSCRVYADNMCVEPQPALSNILSIEVLEINLNLPNAFKPSSTEGNDLFRPVTYASSMPDFEMMIYDRWGNQVFVTNDFKKGWDGTLDGKPAPEGVYVWTIKYDIGDESNQIQTKTQKGTVLLIR
jgi:gliding motility-associated-like protein